MNFAKKIIIVLCQVYFDVNKKLLKNTKPKNPDFVSF